MSFTPTDIELIQGSRSELDFEVTDENGDALDLRNYTIASQIRSVPGASGTLLAQFGVVDIGLSAGCFRLLISSSAAASLPDPTAVPARAYYVAHWDVYVAPTGAASASEDYQYAGGRAFIYPRNTRRT